jgi:hypothetical protein
MTKNRVIPLAAMVGVLFLAYVLDRLTVTVKDYMRSTFHMYQGYILLILLEFLFAGIVILLFWLTMARSKRSVLVGTVFVVVGMIALLYPIFFRSLLTSIPLPYTDLYRYQLQDLPSFQKIFATLFWNYSHGTRFWLISSSPLSFQFITKASVLITLLGVVKFFQKPRQASLA